MFKRGKKKAEDAKKKAEDTKKKAEDTKKVEDAKNRTKLVENTTIVKCDAADKNEKETKHFEENRQQQQLKEKQEPAFHRARSLTITPKGGNSQVIPMSGKAEPLAPRPQSKESSTVKANNLKESKVEEEGDETAVLHFEDDFKNSDYPERIRTDTELSLKFESSYDL